MLFLRYYLWIAPHVLLALFLGVFCYRKLHQEFPVFTWYLLFDLLRFVFSAIFTFHSPPLLTAYRWGVLAIGNAVDALLILGVIYELATKVSFSRSSIISSLRWVFSGIITVLVFTAAVASATFPNVGLEKALRFSDTLDFCSGLIRVGVLLALLFLARALRIAWRGWPAGITLGLGVAASVDLAGAALRGALGRKALIPMDVMQMAGFHICVLIWLAYLFWPRSESIVTAETPKTVQLDAWNQEIERMIRR